VERSIVIRALDGDRVGCCEAISILRRAGGGCAEAQCQIAALWQRVNHVDAIQAACPQHRDRQQAHHAHTRDQHRLIGLRIELAQPLLDIARQDRQQRQRVGNIVGYRDGVAGIDHGMRAMPIRSHHPLADGKCLN
jgi:hypothetical protein